MPIQCCQMTSESKGHFESEPSIPILLIIIDRYEVGGYVITGIRLIDSYKCRVTSPQQYAWFTGMRGVSPSRAYVTAIYSNIMIDRYEGGYVITGIRLIDRYEWGVRHHRNALYWQVWKGEGYVTTSFLIPWLYSIKSKCLKRIMSPWLFYNLI